MFDAGTNDTSAGTVRSALSGVAAVSLLLLGAVGPLVGRVADRWGPRRVIIASIVLPGSQVLAYEALWILMPRDPESAT